MVLKFKIVFILGVHEKFKWLKYYNFNNSILRNFQKLVTCKFTTKLPYNISTVFDWHKQDGIFERLTPAFVNVKVNTMGKFYEANSCVQLTVIKHGIPMQFKLRHSDFVEGVGFKDSQITGPFSFYQHSHQFSSIDDNLGTVINDTINFDLPLKHVSNAFGGFYIKSDFTKLFAYRSQIMHQDLKYFTKYKENPKMKIALTGASGLIGKSLKTFLSSQSHQVIPMVRHKNTEGIYWNPELGELDFSQLEGFDAIIHLAGENIANSPWTKSQKTKLINSRTVSTKLITDAIAQLQNKPKIFMCASAIGYYGDRGSESLDEHSLSGSGFLADLCKAWESSTGVLNTSGIRTVNLRIGLVLSPAGGVLAKILPIFNLGGGGNLGNGKQYMSWIAIDDILGSVLHILNTDTINGAVNLVSPNPVTNSEFTKILGKVISRPTIFPVPEIALKLLLGQMAQELLLASSKVYPKILENTGYEFAYPDLELAFRHLLGK